MAGAVLYNITISGGVAIESQNPNPPVTKVPTNPCTNLKAVASDNRILITWTDPSPQTFVTDDNYNVVWQYTQLVRKAGSVPQDINDGEQIYSSSTYNAHKTTPYTDSNIVSGTTYYYKVFPVSSDGLINNNSTSTSAMVEIKTYRVMTVRINESDSNPDTCCTYQDDAVGMSSGANADEWTEFFGYRPCLFKNGSVTNYLDPDNYTRTESGGTADITSGNSGDVMIEFPRRGIKMNRSGNYLYISMTDDPDASGYTYYAHTRGSSRRENFYLSAFSGYSKNPVSYGALSSLKNTSFPKHQSFDNMIQMRYCAHAKGDGYELMTFYQWAYLQTMMILQFRTLDSESALGTGAPNGTGDTASRGWAVNNGLFNNSSNGRFKAFGIEDLYLENYVCYLDGIAASYTKSGYSGSYTFYVATDDLEPNTSGSLPSSYTSTGSSLTATPNNNGGYITKAAQNSRSGFLPTSISHQEWEAGGSSTTYYCDAFEVDNVGSDWQADYELVGMGCTVAGQTSIELETGIFCMSIGGNACTGVTSEYRFPGVAFFSYY